MIYNLKYTIHKLVKIGKLYFYTIPIKKKINKDNLMLFVLDCINVSTGSYGIGYHFNTENLNKFYGWEKTKKDIHNCPDSDLKKFLVKAIETLNSYKDIDEKDTYHIEEWTSLNNLITKYLNRDLNWR